MLVTARSALFLVGMVVITLLYGVILLPLMLLPVRLRHRILISWCWVIIRWLRLVCGVRFQILGFENVKAEGGAKVYLSKHESAWETFMLQSLLFPTSTILKKELLRIPIFGWGLASLAPISIDRTNPREALKKVREGGIKRLHQGFNLLLFPEGTRVKPGEKGKYARSGPEIAKAAGVDIVPVAVNAGYCWSPRTWVKQPGLVTVKIGPSIATDNKSSRELINEVETWIESQMQLLETKRGGI